MSVNKWYIDKVLKDIDQDLNDKLVLTGELVSSDAKRNAPIKSGNLRTSITYEVDDNEKSVTIGTNVEYAVYQEFGTKYIKPIWFLTLALAENINKIKKIFAKKMKE